MVDGSSIGKRFAAVRDSLDERGRRLFAAAEACTAGHGGIVASARATGVARSTIGRGLEDLDAPDSLSGSIRRVGGGRHALTRSDPTLLEDLRRLLEPATMGDPMRPLLWVSKSHAKLAAALCAAGHKISKSSIPALLGMLKYCGIDNDTAQFSVNALRRWLEIMGRDRYPNATQLMITADGGSSNESRVRLFKIELQRLADETGMTLKVCHFPPGISKWNKIEHRLFCHISQTWRGKPLTSRLAVVELIAATTTTGGLKVHCELDTRLYPKGIKVTDREMANLNVTGDTFHPEWNYTIAPQTQT